jgi:hypothetical protein
VLEQVVGLLQDALVGVLAVAFGQGALGVFHEILEHVAIPDVAALLALAVVNGNIQRYDRCGHIGEDGGVEALHYVNALVGLAQGLLLVFHDEPPKWSGTRCRATTSRRSRHPRGGRGAGGMRDGAIAQ